MRLPTKVDLHFETEHFQTHKCKLHYKISFGINISSHFMLKFEQISILTIPYFHFQIGSRVLRLIFEKYSCDMVGLWLLNGHVDDWFALYVFLNSQIGSHRNIYIPSGITKIWSFHEESLSDPYPQIADIKSGIRAENLRLRRLLSPEDST